MRHLLLPALALLLAGPATAGEHCDEYWFTRNALFARAGYCFSSPLGQAVFGNEGCTTKSPKLGTAEAAKVKHILELEALDACAINTKRTSLEIRGLEMRKRMKVLPVRDVGGSACIGWKGPPVTLRNAPSTSAEAVGEIGLGDQINFEFEREGSWDFVFIYSGLQLVSSGWTNMTWSPDACESVAG